MAKTNMWKVVCATCGPVKSYRIPARQARSAESLEYDAQLYGRNWTDSALCLPWADVRGVLRFAVLSPAYGGDVLICHFCSDEQGGGDWWHESLEVFISGVTHWRLAGETEQESWLDPAQWPEQGAIGISLASQRWHWLHIDGPVKFYKPQTGLGNSHQEQW